MTDLIDEMMAAQSSKSPLIQEIMLGLSTHEKIFVFEGKDDFPVYDEWMKRNEIYRNSCHIIAKGKKQIIETYNHGQQTGNNNINDNCFFFVDHDYDIFHHNDKNIVTLNCYSIENYISSVEFVDNYLKDEFELDARKTKERLELIEIFKRDYELFSSILKELSLPLFVNYNTNKNVPFYEDIKKIINITINNIHIKRDAELIDIDNDISEEDKNKLEELFFSLDYNRAIRGKYIFEFVKRWLLSAKDYLLEKHNIKTKKDPLLIDFRRMACSSNIPEEINSYI
ncbi:hypothetical protein [Proteus mirabilis]|uniref:hypothetical protein n=1 Tax=Proteus mirabilis TaxID=584 RepID=UPI0034D61AC5